MARIVIIDKHPMTSLGIEVALERIGHQVAGKADNGLDGLEVVRTIKPDLVVLDLDIPKLGGLDVIRRIIARKADARILVLTGEPSGLYEQFCMAAGASGFISKMDPPEALSVGVSKVLAGKTYFQATAVRQDAAGEPGESEESLTPREITVLHYLANGYRVKQIATELAISDRTVSTYKTRLLEKTGAQSLVELLRIATYRGLIKEDISRPSNNAENQAASHFDTLLNQLPFPVCLRSPDARVLAGNPAYFDFLDLRPDQILGSNLYEVEVVDKQHLEEVRKVFDTAAAATIPYMVVTVIHVRGERRVVRHSGVPILGAAGELVGMLCTSIDLAEEQQQIQTLQDKVNFLASVHMRRKTYLLQHEEALGRSISSLQERLQGPLDAPNLNAMSALLDGMKESITLVSELVRLESGDGLPAPFYESLNSLTETALQALPAQAVPHWTLSQGPAGSQGWIDPVRYRALIKVLLLHLSHVGVEQVDITSSAFEREPGVLDWKLQLNAAPVDRNAGAPVVYLALAGEITRLLHGDIEIKEHNGHLEVTVVLRVSMAAPS
ncbi:MAG: response regulator [Pseudomonas sp.]